MGREDPLTWRSVESLAEVEEKVEVEVARTEVRWVRAWLEHPSRATLSHVPHHILRRLLLEGLGWRWYMYKI